MNGIIASLYGIVTFNPAKSGFSAMSCGNWEMFEIGNN